MRALLAEQCPDLADRPLRALASGWDNVVFRLGDDLVVRVPRRAMAAALVEHEQRWLPVLAPSLPLPVPAPVRHGRPSDAVGYPWSWSVCPWLEGDIFARRPPVVLPAAAATLGAFVRALHAEPAPPDAPHNPYRGVALAERDGPFRDRTAALDDLLDAPPVVARWERACAVPRWDRAPRWIHGDLHPANLLVHEDRLHAVIDFGDLTSGDPASDLFVAWILFADEAVRSAFRAAAGDVDDDTWARAEGWALLMAVSYVATSADDPLMHAIGRRALTHLGVVTRDAEAPSGYPV